jgi:uncharacterized protein YbjQ (UPF0145 family)
MSNKKMRFGAGTGAAAAGTGVGAFGLLGAHPPPRCRRRDRRDRRRVLRIQPILFSGPEIRMDRIATSGQFNQETESVRRFISATHTESVSLFRGLVAGIGGLIGGKSDTMNKKVDDVMNHLVQKLQSQLASGERIVGTQFQFTEFGRVEQNVFLSGIATGTVVGPKASRSGGGTRRRRRH